MSDLSRRSLLTGVPAAAVTMATPVAAVAAVAVAAGSDPVLAAIEAHKPAWALIGETGTLIDTVAARNQGRFITEADRGTFAASLEAENATFDAILTTPVTTLTGALAMLRYVQTMDDYERTNAVIDAILTSPLAGGTRV